MSDTGDLVKREDRVNYVVKTFKVTDTLEHLNKMMKEVTRKDFNASNVNAACNCVARINETIDTAIKAARFMGGQ